jgi:cytochrome b involved in lipid metabolism
MNATYIAGGVVIAALIGMGGILYVTHERDERREWEAMPLPTSPVVATTTYTMADVALHASKESCWTVVDGSVYDVTSFITKHPGGQSKILGICGKDGSEKFGGQHEGDERAEGTLDSFKIGIISI